MLTARQYEGIGRFTLAFTFRDCLLSASAIVCAPGMQSEAAADVVAPSSRMIPVAQSAAC
jgi:hypothetical protein